MTTDIVEHKELGSIEELKTAIQLAERAIKEVMIENLDYGVIPGCGDKPTLYKPGAEKLCRLFGFAPQYETEVKDMGNGHREYFTTCILTKNGEVVGKGSGSCSTLESKYRWRQSKHKCPSCGQEAIIKGKAEYGGGWLCFKKSGGCGAKYHDGDKTIEGQTIGRTENPDLADTYNTVLKMAQKRAYVGITLNLTAMSSRFTQDIEDIPEDQRLPRQNVTPAKEQPKIQPKSGVIDIEPLDENAHKRNLVRVHELIGDNSPLPDDQKKQLKTEFAMGGADNMPATDLKVLLGLYEL